MCTDGFIARCEISFGRNENHTHTRQPRRSSTLRAKLPSLFPPATARHATIGSWIFHVETKSTGRATSLVPSATSAIVAQLVSTRKRQMAQWAELNDGLRTASWFCSGWLYLLFDRLRVTTEFKLTNSRGSLCAQFSGTNNSIESTIRIEQFLFVKLNKQYYQTFIAATCFCYIYSVSVCLVITVDGFA